MALTAYTTQVQRLLHDPNFQYYSQSELTDYINEARNRVCKDSRCLRTYVASAFTATQGVEQYFFANISAPTQYAGYTAVDIMGATIIWSSTRVKLAYMPWTKFDANMRYWTSLQSRPVAYTRLGSQSIFLGPTPDQSYQVDLDVSFVPPPLITDATAEPIPEPWTTPIKYYAAYLAKFREQAMGEANLFHTEYLNSIKREAASFRGFVIPDPYAR